MISFHGDEQFQFRKIKQKQVIEGAEDQKSIQLPACVTHKEVTAASLTPFKQLHLSSWKQTQVGSENATVLST